MNEIKKPVAILPNKEMKDILHICWMLHNQCNKRCSYCSEPHWGGDMSNLDYDKVVSFLNKIFSHFKKDVFHISFSGGEPVLWKDFDKLCHFLKKNNCEIGLTTNGSRNLAFWKDISTTINWMCLSFHPESSNEDHLIQVIQTMANNARFSVRLMMHKEKEFWDKSVAFGERVKQITNCVYVYVEYVPLIEDFGASTRDVVYEEWQYEFFKNNNNFTVLAKEEVKYNHGLDVWQYETHFDDGSVEFCRPNELVAHKMANFKGWTCYVGLDLLFIHSNGDIWHAGCKQGGLIGRTFDEELNLPTKPIICQKDYCPCGTDILVKKFSSNNSN